MKTYAFLIMNKIIKALPLAILLSIIMSIGQVIQPMFTKIFTSESVKLYDTLNEGVITINQADFTEWFSAYYWPWYLIPSLLIVNFAFKGEKIKKVLVYLSFLIFLCLMATDFLFCACKNPEDQLLANIISNLIGSPIIAIIIILSLDTGNIINQYFENEHTIYRNLVNAVTVVCLGILIAYGTYLIDKNIYAVTASKIDLSVKFPVQGAYGIDHRDNDNIDKNNTLSSYLTPNVQHYFWTGFSKDFSLEWEKNLNRKSGMYKAEIRVLDGCSIQEKDNVSKAMIASPTYVIDNIHNIKLTVDDGFLNMYILRNTSDNGKIWTSNGEKTQIEIFEVKKLKNKSYDLIRFLNDPTQIKHSLWTHEASYVLIPSNIDSNLSSSETSLKNREVHLQIGNQIFKINLVPNSNVKINSNVKSKCKVLPQSKSGIYNLNSIVGGMTLTIRESNATNIIFPKSSNSDETHIYGFTGSMNVNEIDRNELSTYFNNAQFKLLNLSAHIQELYIDENEYKQSISSSNIFVNKAKIKGQITEEGFLKFTGTAHAIYVNENRVNLSRWEKLNIAYKIALYTFVTGVLGFIFTRLRYILNENNRYAL